MNEIRSELRPGLETNECGCETDLNVNLNQFYLTLKMEAECFSEI